MKSTHSILLYIFFLFGIQFSFTQTTNYDLGDGSTFTNTGTQWDPVTSTTSPDGKLRTQAATSLWHSTNYGTVFKNGNSLEVDVDAGNSIVRFYGSIYSSGTMDGGSTIGGNDLEDDVNVQVATDITGFYEFSYSGAAATLYFTFTGANAYTPNIEVTTIVSTASTTDVWDFGAEQLDANIYNNQLDEAAINNWYGSTPAGTSGVVMPSSFTAGALSWTGGNNDRLRTSNTNLTRFDENVGATGYNGRLYVNSTTSERYLSLVLDEDDEVSIWGLSQDGDADMYFVYTSDPSSQTDITTFQTSVSEIKFVAKEAGIYQIYGLNFKPSYYRIIKTPAEYSTVTGNVDTSAAVNIPPNYEIVFTNTAGKVWTTTVTSGTYQIELPIGYSYELSLANANSYAITSDTNLDVTGETTSKDVTIEELTLHTLSGPINGLGSDISNLVLSFVPNPASGSAYTPQPVIDTNNSTYSVELEESVGYTIVAEGVNDYDITDDLVTITEDYVSSINFNLKPTYLISLDTGGYDLSGETNLSYGFTNVNEPGYVYTFADVSNIQLRDGTYQLALNGIEQSAIELGTTPNLVVNGAPETLVLNIVPIKEWLFNEDTITNGTQYYKGLELTGNIYNQLPQGHLVTQAGSIITVPISPGEKLTVSYYYSADFMFNNTPPSIITNSNSTSVIETAEHIYAGATEGFVTIDVAGTSYLTKIALTSYVPYTDTVTVGVDKDYQTINEALDAIAEMARPNDERVTILIDPGNYEEMLVVSLPNITLKNASSSPSIELTNSGVDIASEAVRITGYYGHGYNYYSMGSDYKWNADILTANVSNGSESVSNPGAGSATLWNATVVVSGDGFIAENIIIENSFNQYISLKESQDVLVPNGGEPTSTPRPTTYGNTDVQQRDFVERAAALSIANGTDKVILDNCRIVGRQDSFYGGSDVRVAVYKGKIMGAVDYIFGRMNATFYQSDLVLNTSETNNDLAYITAAQQTSGRGYLFYECNVKSTVPGVDTAASQGVQSGYFGRPWQANTSEVVFYNTTIDVSTSSQDNGLSLIDPLGWRDTLGGQSQYMYEYGTIENSGVDNSGNRASWSTVLSMPILLDGTEISLFNFTKGADNWDPFSDLIEIELVVGVDETMIIEGDYELNSRSSIEILEGGSLTINGNLTNNGQIELNSISNKYSSLIVNGSSTGNIRYKRHVNAFNGTTGNDLVSSPVINQEFGSFATNNPNIYESPTVGNEHIKLFGPFDEQSGDYQIYSTINNNSTIIISGKGYRAARDASEDITSGTTFVFQGGIETGSVNINLTETSSSSFVGWNLIGNPYSSYLDFDAFFAANEDQLDVGAYKAIYGYDGDASDGWTILNSVTNNLLIAPGQGFFVKSKTNGGTVTFTPEMRVSGATDDFIQGRSTQSSFGHLELTMSSNNLSSSTDFYFNSNASQGLDPGYDAAFFGGNAPAYSIYSHLVENSTGTAFSIQALSQLDIDNVIIPIGVNTSQGTTVSIGISQSDIPDTVEVYLEDALNNTFTLLNNQDYTFTPSTDLEGVGRFYLHFGNTTLNVSDSSLENVNAYYDKSNNSIIINGILTDNTDATLVDINGRVILSKRLETNITSQSIGVNQLSKSIYILELKNSKGQVKVKKLII